MYSFTLALGMWTQTQATLLHTLTHAQTVNVYATQEVTMANLYVQCERLNDMCIRYTYHMYTMYTTSSIDIVCIGVWRSGL